jgi:hypothetical protein
MNWDELLKWSLIFWVLCNWIIFLLEDLYPKRNMLKPIWNFFMCAKCFTFWTMLGLTRGDFLLSAGVSAVMWVVFDVIGNKKTRL